MAGTTKHQQVITKIRVYLVENLDIEKTTILDRLIQEGVLSQMQCNIIKESSGTNKNKASALLDHLYMRPEEDWDTFLRSLSHENQQHIVDMCLKTVDQEGDPCVETPELRRRVSDGLEFPSYEDETTKERTTKTPNKRKHESAPSSSEESTQPKMNILSTLACDTKAGGTLEKEILGLRRKLAALIKAFYDNVPLWTLHSDRVAIPMDDIYVTVVLVKEKQRKFSKEETLQSYKELLRKDADRKTIYLTGEPGVGKSTLVNRICVDWASVMMRKDQTTYDEIFEHYLFVLPIFLRDVRETQTLCQVLANEYQLHEIEAGTLCRCIENPQNTILLILDGLDEYDENKSTEITEIIHRKRLPHVTLFITSRFSSESVFSKGKPGRCTEVRLLGFSEAGVKEYIQRYFDEQKEEGNELLTEIKKTAEMEHLSHIPAILLMMATLWEENKKLPSTVVGFYKEFVAYVFARMEKRNLENVADRAKSTEQILGKYNTQIMALGRLSTCNVKTHKLELTFKREDVDKYISSEVLNNGFLIEKMSFSRKKIYIFIHKTVQEYFLAFFLVYSDKSTQQELLLRFFNSRQAFLESVMIRRFVSGLGGEEIHYQLNMLIDGSEEDVAEMHTDLQLEYLAEHQDATLTLPGGVSLNISDRYPASHYVKYLRQDGAAVKKMWINTGDDRPLRLLQHLHAPQLTCLELDGDSFATFDNVDEPYITPTPHRTLIEFPLEKLTVRLLYDENETSALVRAIVQAYTDTLYELIFDETRLTGDRIQTLTEWFRVCHLTSLTISCCDLTSQEMTGVLSVLPSSLQTLDVSYNDMRGLPDTGQLSGVTRSQIQTLNMSGCQLTSRGVLAVIDAAPETLTVLDLSYNCSFGDGNLLVKVTERTTQLNKLKTLNLKENDITSHVMTTIKQKLKEKYPYLKLKIRNQGIPYTGEWGTIGTDTSDSDESTQMDTNVNE